MSGYLLLFKGLPNLQRRECADESKKKTLFSICWQTVLFSSKCLRFCYSRAACQYGANVILKFMGKINNGRSYCFWWNYIRLQISWVFILASACHATSVGQDSSQILLCRSMRSSSNVLSNMPNMVSESNDRNTPKEQQNLFTKRKYEGR